MQSDKVIFVALDTVFRETDGKLDTLWNADPKLRTALNAFRRMGWRLVAIFCPAMHGLLTINSEEDEEIRWYFERRLAQCRYPMIQKYLVIQNVGDKEEIQRFMHENAISNAILVANNREYDILIDGANLGGRWTTDDLCREADAHSLRLRLKSHLDRALKSAVCMMHASI